MIPQSDKQNQSGQFIADAWNELDNLTISLKNIQMEINDEDLDMTIALIEEKPSSNNYGMSKNLMYLSVILMELIYSLSTISADEELHLSASSIEALHDIETNVKAFSTMVNKQYQERYLLELKSRFRH